MMNENPLVSIGVPVYNEERYLSQTLDSLLAQDYPNLELIISDNASNDRTREICQEYVKRDGRVRYYRMDTNSGAVANFNSSFVPAQGKYFMWAGAHDLWDSTFIARALSVLEANPRLVLAYPRTTLIDTEGHSLPGTLDEIDTRGLPALRRCLKVLWNIHWCNMIHGLVRSEAVRRTAMFRSVWGSDILLLAELSLIGEFTQVRDACLFLRQNISDESQKGVDEWKKRYLTTMAGSHDAEQARASLPEQFRKLRTAMLRLVANSDLSYQEKLRAKVETMICFRFRYGVSFPGDALLIAGKRITNRCQKLYAKAFSTSV